MDTPQSANRPHRTHGLATTLSSRKKALFGKDDGTESDLGPMSPLRFGSNRKKSTKSSFALNNITSFRNVFGNESPESDRSLSPDFALKYTNNGRYELLQAGPDKENQQVFDEDTRLSFHSVSETPTGRLSAEASALRDESNSNSLSILMTSDLKLVEKHSQPKLRTPGVMTRSSTAKLQVRSLDPSLHRTHQQQNSTSVTTPDTNNPVNPENSTAKRPSVKARTSLHFNDMPTISTKSFYHSSIADKEAQLELKQVVTPALGVDNTSIKNSPPTTTKSISTAKTPRKLPSMRKRSKSFCSSAPRLGQRGVVHRIRKPSKKPPTNATEKDRSNSRRNKRNTKQAQKNRAIAGGTKSCPTTPKSSDKKEQSDAEMVQQLKRVSEILIQGQNRLQRSRPLTQTRSMTDLSKATLSYGGETDSSSIEDEDSVSDEEDVEDEERCGPDRKFFRSRSGSRSVPKVYNHFNSISLAVRKGGKRKLINFPQKLKRRRTDFACEQFDFESEQLEVDDLISLLDQGSSSTIVYHEQQQQPYETSEYEEAIILDDDEPIPIQSNVIYVNLEDYIIEETQMDSMQYEDPEISSQTIIGRHDDAENSGHFTTMDIENASDGYSQCDQPQWNAEDAIQTNAASNDSTEYYPMFYRDRVKELWNQERALSKKPTQKDVFQLLHQEERTQRQRHGTGQDQYQIDAGQRAYGAVQCTECGLVYSNNEPEEELIHDNFHRSQAKLAFAGWAKERIVSQVPEWDVTGRIIVVSQVDSKQWLAKIQTILEVVDTELGFATHGQLPEGACVYLAIAKSMVLGVCVVQPLQYANRMINLEGLHGASFDCYSSEFYSAKCGVSRIWVSPKFRRLGVGRKLMASLRSHYIFGYAMQYEEIAFGAPTESGKLFAETITGRKDFLVYM